MAWHTIYCPKCGQYLPARRGLGNAVAAWRAHVIAGHPREPADARTASAS